MNDTNNLISKVNDTPRTTPKKKQFLICLHLREMCRPKKKKPMTPKVIRHFFDFCDLGVT
jgi:hypothetical protein